jgi:uncharacterized surface protein with fasciclin (FAS1) repeats
MKLLLVSLALFSVIALSVSDDSSQRADRVLKGMGMGKKGSKGSKGNKESNGICFPTANPHPDFFGCDCQCCLADGPFPPSKGPKGKDGAKGAKGGNGGSKGSKGEDSKGHRYLKGKKGSKGSKGSKKGSMPDFECSCMCDGVGSKGSKGGKKGSKGGKMAKGSSKGAKGGSKGAKGGSKGAKGSSKGAKGGSKAAKGGSKAAKGGKNSNEGGYNGVVVANPVGKGTIVDFVVNNPNLTSLTAAVVQAGLVEALAGSGPLTLFAPTNGAFGALPSDLVDSLLTNDEFIPQLADLLLYHVLSGEFFAMDLSDKLTVTALNGENLLITLPPIAVNGNKVVSADNDVSNGVVHIIDGVLIPSWVTNSIAGRVVAASDLSTLLSLVVLAGIDGALAGPGALTVVAPTNSAFAKLPQDVLDLLTSPAGKSTLVQILTYHVFSGIFTSDRLSDGLLIPTLEGGKVTVSLDPVRFNDSKAVQVDILANNGVVHKIDTVLDPNDSPR